MILLYLRLPKGNPTNTGLVVQLVRIPACHAGGREFESRPDRNKTRKPIHNCEWAFFMLFPHANIS